MAAETTQNQKAYGTAKNMNGMQVFALGVFVKSTNTDPEKIVKQYNLDKIDFYNAYFKLTNDGIVTIDKKLGINLTYFGNQVFESFSKMDDEWHKNIAIEILYFLRKNAQDRSHPTVFKVLQRTLDEVGMNPKEIGLKL